MSDQPSAVRLASRWASEHGDASRVAGTKAGSPEEFQLREAADELIRKAASNGDGEVILESDFEAFVGQGRVSNPYISLKFVRKVPGDKRKTFFAHVDVKLKDGDTYYHVKPVFQKAGAFFDSSSAWSLIESELWQYGRPEDFATVAAEVLRSWESKWGRVDVNKGARSWTWTVPFEDYPERGLQGPNRTNTPPIVKDRSQWQYVHKTSRKIGGYAYKPDPRIVFFDFTQGFGEHARSFWSVEFLTEAAQVV